MSQKKDRMVYQYIIFYFLILTVANNWVVAVFFKYRFDK